MGSSERCGSVHNGRERWRSLRSALQMYSTHTPTICAREASCPTPPTRYSRPASIRAGHGPNPGSPTRNATLPEAMIAAGTALDRPELLRRGLDLLAWLLTHETRRGHLSVTPVGGSGPEDRGPGFDQQPIEAAAIADACARALAVDGDRRWADGITAARDWFLGNNDGNVVMWDPATGGGFDGLQRRGANLNQGTESTLACISTMQQARNATRVLQ